MGLLDQINQKLIQATKTNEPLVRDTLRLLKTAIKNTEIQKGRLLSDSEIVEVLAREVKQRQESEQSFRAGNRPQLAEKELSEIVIIKQYLPEPLSEKAIATLITQAMTQTQATSMADIGKVMNLIAPTVKGKADMALVRQIVQDRLAVSHD